MVLSTRPKTVAEIEALKRWAKSKDQPLSKPIAVPKSIPKKKGRPKNEEVDK